MSAGNAGEGRTVRAWIVVNRGGHPYPNTARYLRRDTIAAYEPYAIRSYASDRRRYGIRVVRCTLTTDPPAPKEEV